MGLARNIGSQITDLEPFREALRELLDMFRNCAQKA